MSNPVEKVNEKVTGLAVLLSLVVVAFVLSVALAIGGSYLLTISAIHHQQTNEQELKQREAESSIRTAIPTCNALVEMDDAKVGASNASNDPHSYGHNLARAITDVVATTQCRMLLREVAEHKSFSQIAKDLGREG